MKWLATLAALLGFAPATLASPAAFASPAQPAAFASPAQPELTISFDRPVVSVVIGDRFELTTRVQAGAAGVDTMLAHLNVASLTSDVYVDPEDWSDQRSQTVPPLSSGAATDLTWNLQAVNSGDFDVYVVLLPDAPTTLGRGPLVVGGPVHVHVSTRPTLTAGGALPVVLAVPILLAGFALSVRLRLRTGRFRR